MESFGSVVELGERSCLTISTYPAPLLSENPFAESVIRAFHAHLKHVGTDFLLAYVRQHLTAQTFVFFFLNKELKWRPSVFLLSVVVQFNAFLVFFGANCSKRKLNTSIVIVLIKPSL